MTVAIIDYGSGNLHSAAKAFERAAREAGLSCPIRVTSRPEEVRAAERVVLPGVGAFADCRRGLDAVSGMVAALGEAVRERGAPFLGVCVGAQLVATRGLEHEVSAGLGWIEGDVGPIKPIDPALKVPHMGWNTVRFTQPRSPLASGLKPEGEAFYFVHSYYVVPAERSLVLAECDYGGPFVAAISRSHCFATQFHPEKSQARGLQIYRNFIDLAAYGRA